MAINSAAELRRKLKKARLSAAQVVEGSDVSWDRLRSFIRGLDVPTLDELERIERLILDRRKHAGALSAGTKVGT